MAAMRGAKKPEGPAHRGAVEPPSAQSDRGCPIVGIGASAGGLAAFEAFFSGMPANDPGMAFVLVQHLSPDHKSILADLVRRYTRMQVFEVTQGMAVKPNCTYIIPPNRNMALVNGTLQLLEPDEPHSRRMAIDFFFRSLAENQHERAICIVLSGTGSDGALGVRAVKGEGGMAIAQNPASTEYDGMPRSAINTGLVDYVLPPAEMAAQLIAYVGHSFGGLPSPISAPGAAVEESQKEIFRLLRARTGHDFSQYKPNAITRCVERRMAVHRIAQLDEYARYLERTQAEVETLFRNLLIGVTSFFRDAKAFEALEEQAVPRLFAGKPEGSLIRVWVPGCSSGEEAYSIAILLQEQLEGLKQSLKAQIFATDIDRQAIDQARAAVYPASIAADISPERLARFFTHEPDGCTFRIHKGIRDAVVFSEHDVIKDPPFSKLDLISCRNLLIYMGAELHRKLIPLFHYALKPGGVLFLGSSETVGGFADLFATMDRKSKLYLCKEDVEGAYRPKFFPLQPQERSVPWPSGKAPGENNLSVREVAERALQQYTPAGALVNERGDILYLHGRTGQYLEPAQGEAGMNILKMAREGLRTALTPALHQAAATQEPVHRAGLRVKTNGDFTTVNLTVQPAPAGPGAAVPPTLYLVVFEGVPGVGPRQPEQATGALGSGEVTGEVTSEGDTAEGAGEISTEAGRRITMLKQELRGKDEYLRIINEEQQLANHDAQASNVEMQSVNEELQSTNEELETTKEELQSVNEELATLNFELQTRLADLSRSNNDMSNLLASTGIGTVFVDEHLSIRHFTPAVTHAINLIPTDVGRPIGHIVSNLVGYDRLVADVQGVLDHLTPKEVEVQTQAGEWYLLNMRPYRTLENVVEGAVITFTEVTEMRKAKAARQDAEILRRLAAVLHDAHDAIMAQDLEGRILAWNPAAQRMYGWSEAEALAMNIRDLIPETGREEELAAVRRQSRGEALEPYRMRRIAKDGRIVEVMLTATALVNESGKAYAIATTEREITDGVNP
ncbi:MCP methyltransferase/methylesterase, CheR/CheB with PAS/PAC sensor [Candidatus Sulfopaludibacter sp. SbA4]|nr:MCP methyltransferase/methylesterase, CheR/CheB with PAS/PAC sensor [Candidatus Sulfopaludibacter sp. SbA4]